MSPKSLRPGLIIIFVAVTQTAITQCYPENTGQGLFLYSPVKTKLTLYKPLLGKEWGDTTYRNCAGFGPMIYRKTVPGYIVEPGSVIYAAHSGIIRIFTSGGNDETNDAAWIDGVDFTTSYFNVYFSVASNQYIYAGQRIGTVIPRKDTSYIYFGIRYAKAEQPTMKRVGLPVSGDNKSPCSCYIDPVWPEHFVNPTSWNIHWDYNNSEPHTNITVKIKPINIGKWSFDEGKTWLGNGESVKNLPQKYYKIIFKDYEGFGTPLPLEINADDSKAQFAYEIQYQSTDKVSMGLNQDKKPESNNSMLVDSSSFLKAIDDARRRSYDSGYKELRGILYSTFNDSLRSKISAIEKEQEQNKRRSMILYLSVPLIIVTGLALVVLQNKNGKLKKEKEQVIDLQKELHHRVRNNLGVILGLLDASTKSGTNTLDARDLENKIKSISLVHEKLYSQNASQEIDLQDFIENLCSHILGTYRSNDSVDIKVEAPLLMQSNLATQLGLIVSELFTNALKHSKPKSGKLLVSIKASKNEDKSITVSVSDNGMGFTIDPNCTEIKSYGIRMVKGLIKQLRGKVDFINDNGAKVVFSI